VTEAFICDAIRTPIGRYGGALSGVRADDLGAIPLRALMERNPRVAGVPSTTSSSAAPTRPARTTATSRAWPGCLPGCRSVPGTTINRLCGSGMDAIGLAARSIKAGEATLMIAGGVEGISRAPFVMGKAESALARNATIFDTNIGWRFVNPEMETQYDTHSMPQTADNMAADFAIARADQDAFALRSQQRWAAADATSRFVDELLPVVIAQKKGDPRRVDRDEHPRPETTLTMLASFKGINGPELCVTAGNASGVNDGACALLASEAAAGRYSLRPLARVVGMATAGVPPRIMGIGPAPAVRKVLARAGLTLAQMDVIEVNEAFAAQVLAVLRDLGLADDAPQVNPNSGAIALGQLRHPARRPQHLRLRAWPVPDAARQGRWPGGAQQLHKPPDADPHPLAPGTGS
jgi:acetyl-CoA acetyltransferase family protein